MRQKNTTRASQRATMRPDAQKEILLRALDAFRHDVVIISPDFRIVAANRRAEERWEGRIVGQVCHRLIHRRESPCDECPALEVLRTGRPSIMQERFTVSAAPRSVSCYPIFDQERIEALAMVDYDLSRLTRLEEGYQRANTFLRNTLLNAVDGIIATDRTGKVIIFNQAAAEATGYTIA